MNEGDYYRKRALKRLGIIAAVLVVLGIGSWYAVQSDSLEKISAIETSVEQTAATKIAETFSAPVPLIASDTTNKADDANDISTANPYALTRAGVIADTNTERAENGSLPPLAENATLDEVAQIRLADMFAKQYFAHISPSSSSAITVASSVGYEYIALGENLALGNFEGDQGVLTAWMNSPGHRANILDTHYTQIGVAVGEGNFQGANVWIAVQVFGRPLSDCPQPNANLDAQINAAQIEIAQMQSELQSEDAEINAMQPQSGDAYQQAVSDYNALVAQYNNLVATTKSEITQYNAEVDSYNQCVAS